VLGLGPSSLPSSDGGTLGGLDVDAEVVFLDPFLDDQDTDDVSSLALVVVAAVEVLCDAPAVDVPVIDEALPGCVDTGAVGANFDCIGGTTGLLLAVAVRRDAAAPGGRLAAETVDPLVPVLATELLSSLSASLFCCSKKVRYVRNSFNTDNEYDKMSSRDLSEQLI
jgi:hypothetical protein